MATTYGIISDAHQVHPGAFELALSVLDYEEADIIIYNGDISGERFVFPDKETGEPSRPNSLNYLAVALTMAANSGKRTYVLPGSHEEAAKFEPLLEEFSEKHPNIINAYAEPVAQHNDHNLVFQAGTDVPPEHIGNRGYLWLNPLQNGIPLIGAGKYLDINDISKNVQNPENTLFVSHVPAQTSSLENGVDFADFWYLDRTVQVDGQVFREGSIVPATVDMREVVQRGVPFKRMQRNAGNASLGRILKETGINKTVSGHFHESVGRVHDDEGNKLDYDNFTPSMHCNASCLDQAVVGLVTVDKGKAVYEALDLRNYAIRQAGQ